MNKKSGEIMERNYAIDYIKFYAIFSVVLIHNPIDGSFGFILDSIARFAVPFFFVAAGFLFGQHILKGSNPGNYFKKYIAKLIKIYASWLAFYMLYDITTSLLYSYIRGLDISKVLINYFEKLTLLNLLYYGEGTTGYHLWFLPALIWSATILFIMYHYKKVNLLLIISLVFHIIGLFGQSYSDLYQLPIATRDPLFFGLFYTSLGFFFALHYEKIKRFITEKERILFYSFIISIVLQVVERSITAKTVDGGDYNISTIFVTIALFFLVLNYKQLGKESLLSKIGRNSLGIYVIHVVFLNMTDTILSILDINYLSEVFIWQLTLTPIVFIISYISYNFIQHIKRFLFSLKKSMKNQKYPKTA